MARKSPVQLPLPFGEKHAIRHKDEQAHGDFIEQIFPGLNGYEARESQNGFFSKTTTVRFPSLTVVASAMSASRVDREGRQQLTLMLPLMGQCGVTIGDKSFGWGAGRAGMLLPEHEGRIIGTGEDRCILQFRLNTDCLTKTARAMLGPDVPAVDLNLHEARLIPLNLYGKPVEPLLQRMGMVMDMMDCEVDLLTRQGHEDWFNRLIVSLLHPELFETPSARPAVSRSYRTQVIRQLTEEMLADLGKKITQTELEEKSGYSARSLQYAFQESFGCSPLEWLREQRLLSARQVLLTDGYQTLAQIAHQFGFGGASQFCTAYKGRFGETPNQTRKRHLRN